METSRGVEKQKRIELRIQLGKIKVYDFMQN